MSMWDFDEQGDPDPPVDRHHYWDPYASHSGSSDYHGGHGGHSHSHSDHSHHNHDHGQGHVINDDAYSYQGQRLERYSPGPTRHESHVDHRDHQGRGHDSYGNQGHSHNHESYVTHNFSSNNASVQSPARSAHQNYRGNQGSDRSAGYEIRQEHQAPPSPPAAPPEHGHGASRDLFTSDSVVNLTLDEIDALARTHRSRSWLVVLYAPWCSFCQAMEPNFERVARHLQQSSVYVGRFRADGDSKEYAKRYLQLETFPTVLFFPKDSPNIVKYQSQNREVDALLGFVHAFE